MPDTWVRALNIVVSVARVLLEAGRGRLAILVDEAFQVLGSVREAAFYVKSMLGLIEYPPRSYERIVAIIATSEGLSRREIGRHMWASVLPIWNMPRDGFRMLYEQIPGDKPGFEELWKLTGGNPRLLGELYATGWSTEEVVDSIVASRKLRSFIATLTREERRWLTEAVEDPDTLFTGERAQLLGKLVELNLVVDDIPERRSHLWIDNPPPEKDLDVGIGRYVAWQTPLHREAVRRVLEHTLH